MPNKPKWVEALEEAESCLRSAANAHIANPEAADAMNRSAGNWMDIARIYRDSVSAADG